MAFFHMQYWLDEDGDLIDGQHKINAFYKIMDEYGINEPVWEDEYEWYVHVLSLLPQDIVDEITEEGWQDSEYPEDYIWPEEYVIKRWFWIRFFDDSITARKFDSFTLDRIAVALEELYEGNEDKLYSDKFYLSETGGRRRYMENVTYMDILEGNL